MVDGEHTYDVSLALKLLELTRSDAIWSIVFARKPSMAPAVLETALQCHTDRRSAQDFWRSSARHAIGLQGFSRRFIKSFPITSTDFGIETKLTVHTLELDMPVAHMESAYAQSTGMITDVLSLTRAESAKISSAAVMQALAARIDWKPLTERGNGTRNYCKRSCAAGGRAAGFMQQNAGSEYPLLNYSPRLKPGKSGLTVVCVFT